MSGGWLSSGSTRQEWNHIQHPEELPWLGRTQRRSSQCVGRISFPNLDVSIKKRAKRETGQILVRIEKEKIEMNVTKQTEYYYRQ